jgi:hypothetical protein
LQYGPRHAAYDLKKLRGKHVIRRIAHTRRYEPLLTGLRAMTALLVLKLQAALVGEVGARNQVRT